MVSYMHASRWMRWPREDFPLTVAPQVGGKNLVRHREIGEDQLTGAQERCQGLRYGGRVAKGRRGSRPTAHVGWGGPPSQKGEAGEGQKGLDLQCPGGWRGVAPKGGGEQFLLVRGRGTGPGGHLRPLPPLPVGEGTR